MNKYIGVVSAGLRGIVATFFALFLFIAIADNCRCLALEEEGDSAETVIEAYLNQTKIIPVDSPTRVAIANPQIADINDVSKNEIIISPKGAGATTLVIWDSSGEHSYRIRVLSEDVGEIKRRVDLLLKSLDLPEVYTKTAGEEGKVLLLGRIRNAKERERIITAIGTLKDKIVDLLEIKEEEAAVDIDMQIVELNRDATKTLGFTMPSSVSASEPSGAYPSAFYRSMEAIYHVFEWPRSTSFSVTLNALVEEGKAKVLSQPRITCQSGKEAEIMVGGEKPILTTEEHTAGGSSTTVSYKEYGIKMKIKPVVSQDNKIKLGLKVEVSDVEEAEILGSKDYVLAKAYPLKKRQAGTELFLNDGQTVAIGGLIKQKTEEEVSKTAGLGDIPILGLLFRKKTTKVGGGFGERGNTELFIVLTPTIIRNENLPPQDTQTNTGVASPVSKRSRSPEVASDPLVSYCRFIQTRILERLNYPLLAKDAGFQGRVVLGLHLSSAGELLDVAVKSSSGYKMLDDSAVTAAKALYPYPPFPDTIKQKELRLDIPIDYRLD